MVRIGIKNKVFFLLGFLCWGMVSAGGFVSKRFSGTSDGIALNDSTTSKKKRNALKRTNESKVGFYKIVLGHTNLRKDITESARREKGNSVSTNSFTINDVLEPSTLSNVVSFNIYDKRLNVHSFSGTQSFMYGLNFTSENNVNTKRDLIGFEYRFKKADTLRFGYSARARLERDNESRTYYQIGIGASFKGEKRINLLGLDHFPVRSGPGHILEIYRTQFTSYNAFQMTKRLKQVNSFETNYYSDENADFILLSRTEYLLFESYVLKVSPLMEAAYGLGTINRRDSYPYWMAAKRIYGGGGLALSLGSKNSKFQMVADASIFTEIDQANFERYTGSLSYHIKDFTTLNVGFEVYTIDNFYSNVFQFGMAYNFE